MAKHKSQRALFELLATQRGLEKGKPDAAKPAQGEQAPGTPLRPVEPPRQETPAPIVRPVGPPAIKRAAVVVGGVPLMAHHLVIIAVVIVCLCVFFYYLGAYLSGGDGLPETVRHPTMEEIRGQPVAKGLVKPSPPAPAPTKPPEPTRPGPSKAVTPAPGPAKVGPGPGPTPPAPPAPTGPQFRVRIARLEVTNQAALDDLQGFLAGSGVQTNTEARGDYVVLYSREQFSDKAKSDALAAEINKHLEAYERQTRRPTSKDAYTVQVKKE